MRRICAIKWFCPDYLSCKSYHRLLILLKLIWLFSNYRIEIDITIILLLILETLKAFVFSRVLFIDFKRQCLQRRCTCQGLLSPHLSLQLWNQTFPGPLSYPMHPRIIIRKTVNCFIPQICPPQCNIYH